LRFCPFEKEKETKRERERERKRKREKERTVKHIKSERKKKDEPVFFRS